MNPAVNTHEKWLKVIYVIWTYNSRFSMSINEPQPFSEIGRDKK